MSKYVALLSAILWLVTTQISMGLDTEDIVALWCFDKGRVTIARDDSGNGHDGTIHGAAWVQGKYGKGLQFDGVRSKVLVPSGDDMALEAFTIEAWVKLQPTGLWISILMRGHNPRNYALILAPADRLDSDCLFLSLTSGGKDAWKWLSGGNPVTDNEWHHVAATYDGQFGRLFLDGEDEGQWGQVGQVLGIPDKDAFPAMIGIGNSPQWRHYLKGIMDEVCLWRVALDAEEIQETMEGLREYSHAVTPQSKLATLWGQVKN